MSCDPNLLPILQQLADALQQRGWMLATAESCTGGMIAAACTELPGSSNWFDRGFVTYSNDAKTEMLSVPAALIAEHGAVSEAVVRAMAKGAITHSKAQVSVAVSGVAGPGGGTPEKPVGTVWVAWQIADQTYSQCVQWEGDRLAVRQQTTHHALQQLLLYLLQAQYTSSAAPPQLSCAPYSAPASTWVLNPPNLKSARHISALVAQPASWQHRCLVPHLPAATPWSRVSNYS